jgi:3-oxoacyl-[acyl-carrier protein] reductase
MDLGLAGKKAILSGGTRGIGRAIVETLCAEGVEVAFCARKGAEVAEAEAALKAKGYKVHGAAVDVKDGESYKAWINTCAEKLGGVDIFIPNVSAGGGMGGEEKWRDSFEVDLLGAVRGAETVAPHLEKTGGAIVFISTTAATESFVGPQAYNAIKAAINNYAKNLATTMGPKGVRVNAVSPGPVYFAGGSWEMIEKHMKPFYDMTMRQIPMGRMASPQDVANAVAFLASPAAGYVTGTTLTVDGGMTKRVDY